MKCMYCQGSMEQGTAPFHIDRNGYHLTLQKVPAWICKQCGEPYFEEFATEAIQRVIESIDDQAKGLQQGQITASPN